MWKLSATFNLSNDPEWETPEHIFELGCDTFDFTPEIDVCANSQNTKCDLFFSQIATAWHCDRLAQHTFSPVQQSSPDTRYSSLSNKAQH